MLQSFIIESNQSIAKKNYSVDYGKTLNETENNAEITNNKWKIKLPKSIKLDPGDRISYYSSAVKTQGLSDEGVELIGTAQENELLVDNKMKMDLGYYVSNNWLNNTPLPLGLSTLREFTNKVNLNQVNYRLFNFQDTKHSYNICDETPESDSLAYLSDYGGPNLGEQTTGIPLSDIQPWIDNSSVSLNERADDLSNSKYGLSNGNTIATNHLKLYTPDTTRFYLSDPTPFTGFYSNGYDTYHNVSINGTYNKKWTPLKSEAVVESNLGFNSPVVIGQKITESLNDPNLADDSFVKSQVIDYVNVTNNTSITTLKNHYEVVDTLQVVDECCKNYPTSFGKMIYDINNGVDNFSINEQTKNATGILYPTLGQRAKYFWNSIATGDINRTQAISELYENLKNSKNVQTLNPSNLANSSFFSGTIAPPSGLTIPYPTSSPFNYGEQMVLFDDLEGFSINFTQTEIDKTTSNILFRSDTETDYAAIKKPALTDKHLNLQNNNVIMTNMIANDTNFNTLKKVFDYLEKPSSDNININYNDQTFLDSLYASFEIGRMDDRYTQSVYNIHNAVDGNGNFTNKRIGNGIIMPVALPPPEIITQKYEVGDIESRSYIGYKNRPRLPIYSGLVANESNISELKETGSSGDIRFTYVNEMNNNKMYEYDYYTRYNENRTPSSNTLTLPSSTSFDFKDANGNYFDDSKIKELGLGCVVAYKNIIEDGDVVLEFGLGSQPGADQFKLYSVDTTNNYSENSGVFVNKSADSDLTKFGDNSVQSLTTNNTIYLSQNTTNAYSETDNLQTISPSKALVVEYEASKPFIPNEVELYQQASYPDGNAVQENTFILGVGAGEGEATLTELTTFPLTPLSNAFNDLLGVFNGNPQEAYFSVLNTQVKGFIAQFEYPQAVDKFYIWRNPNDTVSFSQAPKFVTISGSNDGSNYTQLFSNLNGTGFTFSDYPDTTSLAQQKASDNLDKGKLFDLQNTTAYTYYRVTVPEVVNPDPDYLPNFRLGVAQFGFSIKPAYQTTLGAGINLSTFTNGGGSVVINTKLGASADSRGFDNITGDFANCLVFGSTFTITIDYGEGITKNIKHFRMWARNFHSPDETPLGVEIFGSNDNFETQTSLFNGSWSRSDVPTITGNIIPSENLNLSLKKNLTTTGDYRYYRFQFPTAPNNYYSIGELALYEQISNNDRLSRFPKNIQIQGQQINSTTWITLDNHSLTNAPTAAGFVEGQALPQNPLLSSLAPPIKDNFNQAGLSYKKLRLIITETFGYSGNNVNIGEWVLRKRNNFTTWLGDNTSPFNPDNINLDVYLPNKVNGQYLLDKDTFVNTNPNGALSPKDAIRDGNLSTDMDVTLNTTNTYSPTDNQVIIGSNESAGQRFFAIEYFFLTATNLVGQVFNNFLIYTTTIVGKLQFLPKDIEILGSTGDNFTQESLFTGTLSPTQPVVATDINLAANSPYGAKTEMNTDNDKYKSFTLVVKSTYNLSSNRCVIPDIIVSGYDSENHIVHNTPFIGMVCREQITSANKYKIPLPIAQGEFTGLSRSLQNNEWSFINSWERKVTSDNRGVVVAEITLEQSANFFSASFSQNPVITAEFFGGDPQVNATISVSQKLDRQGVFDFITITDLTITNNGAFFKTPPIIVFKLDGDAIKEDDAGWMGKFPKYDLVMGEFKTSYNAGTLANNNPNFPYITIGSNDLTCEFDETQSRMNFNKMHTLMRQGQASNGLSRYYDNSMPFNSAEPLIAPDSESGNEVMKIHTQEFYLNSCRAGFTAGISKRNLQDQIIPISNPFINSKGIASSLSGIGIMGLHVGKKDGTYNEVSQFNKHSYTNCLFDKLGFKIEQLLPLFGNQNNIFNRGSHNRYITDNKLAVSKLNNMVKPVTTGGFISATLNQSLNTSNLNYLMGSLDGNNQLEKSVAQVSDALIGINLPQKFSYSHLLVYSNIVNKYNYVGGQIINDIPCVGSINRSYQEGNFIYGNTPGLEYTIDKTKILTDIDVDLRTNLGTPANIGEGSTITFKIDKFRDLPLALQEKK